MVGDSFCACYRAYIKQDFEGGNPYFTDGIFTILVKCQFMKIKLDLFIHVTVLDQFVGYGHIGRIIMFVIHRLK